MKNPGPIPPTKASGRAMKFATTKEDTAREQVQEDLVSLVARNYMKSSYTNMTLINHRGVGCEVDKDDLMSIKDDQWITDGVLDFHNVLLSIRKPTLRDGKTWAALDCKAYFQTNSCGVLLTLGNGLPLLQHDYLAIPVLEGCEEVVSAATELLMQGNPVRSGAKAEAGGTKNAAHTPQRPSGRKRFVDSSPEEDVVRNATRVALASSFAACDPTARLLQNPLLSGGTIPYWMFTRGRPLLGLTVSSGADAWGDTSGHETVKAEEEEDLVSDTEDEEDGDDTCATKYTGVKLEKTSGKFGVKILIKEGGKRRQQRLGAYTLEEETAYAYAAGAFVLRPRDKIPNTVSLSAVEKAMLRGCTKEDLQLLVEARKWWRWRSWREAREGVNWKMKRGRKRVVATRTSKRQRVVDRNKAANEPD
ncbi:unnamed protein product [Closterium sp. NIES-65]|nr:unnamed protein product [Closterium sp. NIES-65]